ncbi:MAG: pyridoxal 5'-phosphate synthase glutaminase subunit PdxT [Acidimicrobiales bacterium]|jgi:5'-phosphate synthase pdxT subunit|nr:pyridoxal 5'-phosphate synthase glutaminase subunit PdxT [Acidimicrobiales bacterium]|tara:strand:- start:1 stop:576 length:576 start_codon:yes stop_codon:yes gene_type:complete
MKVGVLALQGAFARHSEVLTGLGAVPLEVRTPGDLDAVDAMVVPGGESTTMSMLLDSSGLRPSLAERLADGLPVLGTCAGMILLAVRVTDGRDDQRSFGAIDIDVRRNGYGRQVDSFEDQLSVTGLDGPFHGVFIRAPVVERVGSDVEVLATVDGVPVLCREGAVLVSSFHPEMSGDGRIHERFLDLAFGA